MSLLHNVAQIAHGGLKLLVFNFHVQLSITVQKSQKAKKNACYSNFLILFPLWMKKDLAILTNLVKDSDRIFVFENGQIVEQGSHSELMQLDDNEGVYKRLVLAQAIDHMDEEENGDEKEKHGKQLMSRKQNCMFWEKIPEHEEPKQAKNGTISDVYIQPIESPVHKKAWQEDVDSYVMSLALINGTKEQNTETEK